MCIDEHFDFPKCQHVWLCLEMSAFSRFLEVRIPIEMFELAMEALPTHPHLNIGWFLTLVSIWTFSVTTDHVTDVPAGFAESKSENNLTAETVGVENTYTVGTTIFNVNAQMVCFGYLDYHNLIFFNNYCFSRSSKKIKCKIIGLV